MFFSALTGTFAFFAEIDALDFLKKCRKPIYIHGKLCYNIIKRIVDKHTLDDMGVCI